MTGVLFNFTRNCNLRCSHCCDSCGPNEETMSWNNIKKVLNNLPKKINRLLIGGGEPFVEIDLLAEMFDYLYKNKTRIIPHASIGVQTNGFWALNEEQAYRSLKKLAGTFDIVVTGKDGFHEEQGLDLSEIVREGNESAVCKAIGRANYDTETTNIILITIDDSPFTTVLPFGRAKSLEKNYIRNSSSCYVMGHKSNDLLITVEPDGKAYPCCWCVTPSIGSAIENPLEKLIVGMERNEIFSTFMEKGLAETARILGTYKEEDVEAYEKNPCSKCEEIFRGVR